MVSWDWSLDDDPAWGAGLQVADPRFPLDSEVAIKQTVTGQSTVGYHELVVKNEVGRVSREGSHKVLVRMDRRHVPVSIYLPVDCIEPIRSL